ncbi:hypothetical protein NUW58_g9980 [Xylaria curta]|uniref:Uncharacterized protein n=1 Tax=Xylaria curta TaxID=42375 RepID=A0ACC1MS96_9PEZI|nr:hypothetical protein NUW58_g9980 [Xylaria curta]
MYPLGHQDLAAARVAMAGHNSSASEPSLHRHRTTSSRLSCISEHQKENTPNSEDDCFPFPAQFAQTPSLVPVRRTHSDRHTSRKSRSSGDSSAANALQLDPEQTEGVGPQGKHHRLALSTWGRVAPTGPEERIERHDARDTKFSRSASPEILEMKWQITQRTGQAGNMNIKEHAFAILGLGLDGPRSSTSGSSPLDSPSHISRLPLGALSLSNCMATKPRSSKSNTSGSIDWDKSWPKRKPQRRHDVSESSDRDPSAHKSLIDTTTLETRRKKEMAPLTHEEQEDQSRLSEGQEPTPQSHPEFFQRPPSAIQPTTSRFSV